MPDYSKTLIYKITCNDDTVTDIYVGHTVDFNKRRNNHKSKCSNENSKGYNLLIYQTIRANGGWNNWSMSEVEQFPCENKTEAIAREGYWYKELNGTMNICVPSRTKKEYNQEWYQDNKEKKSEISKDYYQANNEQLKEKAKDYYQNNKEQILKKEKQQMSCECGSCFRISDKARHQKSKKHLNYLNSL